MALISAALLAFALSFDETIITLFLVGDTEHMGIGDGLNIRSCR